MRLRIKLELRARAGIGLHEFAVSHMALTPRVWKGIMKRNRKKYMERKLLRRKNLLQKSWKALNVVAEHFADQL